MKLTKLINSQISVNNKSGVSFDSQINENELHDCHLNKSEVFESASNSSVNEIEEENNQVNDRFKKVEGDHAVPPPYTGNYMPSRPDLSFAGLDNSVYKTNVSETITSVPKNESTASKSSKDSLEQPKEFRPSAPIIEEWESDSDDDCVFRPSIKQNKPSYAKINFVKSDENTRKSVIEQNTYRQAENLRKSQSPRVDKRNWNGIMTQKLGNGFEFIKKACFVCGSLNHLIKDCNFYENKMVGKSVLNNMGRVTGQREIRPVWNNAQRVNHQNKFTHPHPKRNFVPTAVVTKSGQVPVNAAMQSSPRVAASISTARPVNTAAPKSKVNDALPKTYSYFKAHSPVRRTFNQKSAAKTNNLNEKVKTARVNNVTTAGPKAVVSTAEGKRENVVKSLACWIWRPTGKGNPQYALQDQGIFDSGCSSHMTGNKSYLTDYQDIDGGFVAFAGSPKGGKITRKCKIRTGKLDFEDAECLVLSPDFKLLNESQVLLKVHRQNNMYSFDLKNVVPSEGSDLVKSSEVIQALTDLSWIKAMQEEVLQFKLQKFEQMMHKRFQMSSIGELTFFLELKVQQKEDGIFISQDKYVADILKKFDFVTVKTTSTPMEPNKALVKDEEADNVDVHLYRLLIRSLMYLTASRPDIPFDVCACGRLISWQCKKQTIVANSTTKAEYVATANCYGHVLWIPNQMLDYGFNFMNTKIYIDNESTICIVKNPVFHSKTKHIEIRHHFIRDSHEKKLIQVIKIHIDHNVADLLTKAFDVSRFNFLIASIGMLNLLVPLIKGMITRIGDAFWMKLRYTLTKNPTIYVSLIEKFWQTATVRTVDNGEQEINVTVDGTKFTINVASVRASPISNADGV
ncbi:ribonuclease H-like domain-containing protein [Tanacetum coccineum]|uniref:Ribonuclease H-like domain-containing protein n=1 Tax=Tanacetum coccineum TaxID=301880 RepID=A0ABQ5C8G0_9ASTR